MLGSSPRYTATAVGSGQSLPKAGRGCTMSSSHSSGDGSKNSSAGYSQDEPSQGPAPYAARSFARTDKVLGHLDITPNIRPAYDGTTSWFEYERYYDAGRRKETTVTQDTAPGIASVQKEALDRTRHASKNGVEYFKTKMRPLLVKGEQSFSCGDSWACSRRGRATKTS